MIHLFFFQSAEKVLILEYMDGVRLNDSESLQELGVDKQKLVEEITRAYAHQIYVDGFFNGDPHPGTLSLSLSLSNAHQMFVAYAIWFLLDLCSYYAANFYGSLLVKYYIVPVKLFAYITPWIVLSVLI